jgi:hypothetical protein
MGLVPYCSDGAGYYGQHSHCGRYLRGRDWECNRDTHQVQMGAQRVVTTNAIGDFNAPSMPLGDHQISAEIVGFQKKIISGVNWQVDQTAFVLAREIQS